MEQLPEFFANHPVLCLAFVGIVAGLALTFVQGGGVLKLGPVEATRLINGEDAVVVDVRGDGEFHQGHILNSVNVPHNLVEQQLDKLDKFRARPLILACRTGQRSAAASRALRKHGFEKVYHLSGGLTAWEGANLPLVKR